MELFVGLVGAVGVTGICVLGCLLMFNRIRLTPALFSLSFCAVGIGGVWLFGLFWKGFAITSDVALYTGSLLSLAFAGFLLREAIKNKNYTPVVGFTIDKQTTEDAVCLIENFIESGLAGSLSPTQKARLVTLVCFYNKGSEKVNKSTFLKMVAFVRSEQVDTLGILLSAMEKFISVMLRSQLVLKETQKYQLVSLFIDACVNGEIKMAEGDDLEEVVINKLYSIYLS